MLPFTPMAHGVLVREGLALIFDMDGVIVDSTPVHNESWQVYLRRHGIDQPLGEIESGMLGKHNAEIVATFFGSGLSAEQVFRHGADKEKVYREMMAPRLAAQMVPGVAEFVRRHRDLPLAVASNAEPENIAFVLEQSGLHPFFRVVIDGHQVKRPKPDPEIFLRAAALLEVAPANCIVFEDSDTGIRAARAAGARVVGLTTTSPELPGCDLTIPDFRQPALERWLAEQQPATTLE